MRHPSIKRAAIALALASMGCAPAFAASCTTPVGAVMSLTGSLGVLGQQIAKGSELAVADFNASHGANTCDLKLSLLDDQTSPSVGVDAAKKLVDVQQVPAIIGALSSGVSAAILTSVADDPELGARLSAEQHDLHERIRGLESASTYLSTYFAQILEESR